MQPDDTLVKEGNAFAMGSTNELAAYLPAGGSVTLDLSRLAGQLEARWFDPLEGAWGEEFAVQGGRIEKFTAPNANDWGLFLRNYTDSKTPAAPAHVQATALAPSSIRVTWTASTDDAGVAGYKVFRNDTQVATSALPSYTDRGLTPGKSYAYAVVAFDLSGNSSAPSTLLAMATTPHRAPFCKVDLGAEDVTERLKHVTDPDGATRPTKADGKDCREPASTQDHYFYFAIDDDYLHNEAGITMRLEVFYLDESGFIEPQYDSVTGPYTNAERIQLMDTGRWKTAIWTLPQCKFTNRQNAGADFRLFVGNNQVKVASVKLLTVEKGGNAFGTHPHFSRHFVYCGKPFFFVGKSAFALIDAEQWKDFIDEAHRDGFTVLRIWLCCPSLTKKHGSDHFHRNQAAGDLWPFGGMPEKPDFTRFNDNYFRCFDAILRDMDSRGMVAELTLFTGGDFWPSGPFVWDEVKQRYVQFILDRYKDQPNLYYEIANEYYSPEGQAFVEKVGDFIWDQDKVHIVTASAGDVAQFANKPWYRLHNFHPSRGQNWWERVYHEVLIPARSHRLPMAADSFECPFKRAFKSP
jgi:hypothetical protein